MQVSGKILENVDAGTHVTLKKSLRKSPRKNLFKHQPSVRNFFSVGQWSFLKVDGSNRADPSRDYAYESRDLLEIVGAHIPKHAALFTYAINALTAIMFLPLTCLRLPLEARSLAAVFPIRASERYCTFPLWFFCKAASSESRRVPLSCSLFEHRNLRR